MCMAGGASCISLTCAAVAILAHHAAGITEADLVRWAGVLVGFLGAVVIAPLAPARIVQAITTRINRLAARLFKRRKSVNFTVESAVGKVGFGGQARPTVRGGSTDQRLEQLEKDIDQLHLLVTQHEQNLASLASDVTIKVGSVRTDVQGVRDDLAERDKRDDRLDAEGLPLVALGILMTGLPDGLAEITAVGIAFICIAVVLSVHALFVVVGTWLHPGG